MSLKKEEIDHIAKLARMNLTAEESKLFSKQLTDVFDYMNILKELDTSVVEETNQVTGLENVTREDLVRQKVSPQELLECSVLPKEGNQIKVKKVL